MRMFEDFNDDPVYTVKAIAQQLGIMASTLRAWERRYGVPKPDRTGSGYRLYSSRDIAVIRWLKTQIDSGMSISHAVGLLHALQHGPPRSATPTVIPVKAVQSQPNAVGTPSSETDLQRRLLAHAVLLDEGSVDAALNEAFSRYSIEHVCMSVIQPALVTIGERWHRGEIGINVEHFFSSLMRRKLYALLAACPAPIRHTRIIAGCAPEDLHEMGILMISLFLRRRGYDVVYLGQNISLERLEELFQSLRPNGLLLSAGTLRSAARLVDVGEFLAAHHLKSVVFAYGGPIFNALPDLRFQIPGYPLSLTTMKAINSLGELFENPNTAKVIAPTATRESRDMVITLQGSRIDLLSIVVEASKRMVERTHVSETAEHLLKVLEAGVRLNQPALLQNLSNWEWDNRLQNDLPRLHNIVLGVEHAVRRRLADRVDYLLPYLAALKRATTLDKD